MLHTKLTTWIMYLVVTTSCVHFTSDTARTCGVHFTFTCTVKTEVSHNTCTHTVTECYVDVFGILYCNVLADACTCRIMNILILTCQINKHCPREWFYKAVNKVSSLASAAIVSVTAFQSNSL